MPKSAALRRLESTFPRSCKSRDDYGSQAFRRLAAAARHALRVHDPALEHQPRVRRGPPDPAAHHLERLPALGRKAGTGAPIGTDSALAVARQTVLHDSRHPSRIVLPSCLADRSIGKADRSDTPQLHRRGRALATVVLHNAPQNRIGVQDGRRARAALRQVESSGARAFSCVPRGSDFSFGGDIEPWPEWSDRELRSQFQEFMEVFNRFERIPVPTITAVQGLCFGGGFELALRSDVVFAGEGASFGHPEQSIAIVTLLGGVYRVAERAGRSKAMEWALTSERVAAARSEALRGDQPGRPGRRAGGRRHHVRAKVAHGPTRRTPRTRRCCAPGRSAGSQRPTRPCSTSPSHSSRPRTPAPPSPRPSRRCGPVVGAPPCRSRAGRRRQMPSHQRSTSHPASRRRSPTSRPTSIAAGGRRSPRR